LEDVRLERYSVEQARKLYGVVLVQVNANLSLDEAATNELRSQMRKCS